MSTRVPTCSAVLSIIGRHANKTVEEIVKQKCQDIASLRSTLWFYQSWKACVGDVQNFGKAFGDPAIYFLEGSGQLKGTTRDDEAIEKSEDGVRWDGLPTNLKVTGKLPGSALVLSNLTAVHDCNIDLWDYVEYPFSVPVKFGREAATVCAIPAPSVQTQGMISRERKVVAVGKLAPPFAVYLKS
jgi:hypothetical protein